MLQRSVHMSSRMLKLSLAVLMACAVVATSTSASADCIDPYYCACMGPGTYAGRIVEVQSFGLATLVVDAVAVGDSWPEVGDELQIESFEGIALESRWLVVGGTSETDPGGLNQEIPANDQFACLDTTFSLQQVLDLSSRTDCRTAARKQAGLEEDDDYFDCDDTGFSCALPPTSPSAPLGSWRWTLALCISVLVWRRRQRMLRTVSPSDRCGS